MYDPYRRFPPFNYPSQRNYRYANNPWQGSYRYANNPPQGNYGFVNSPPQGNYGYVNNPPQGNYGFVNSPPQGNYGYVNNPPQGNYGFANSPMQRSNGFANNNQANAGRPNNNAAAANIRLADNGPGPFVAGIDEAVKQNSNFRMTLWTGEFLQLTLMSINPGEDMGFDANPGLDQFIRIEEGSGILVIGDQKDNLDYQKNVSAQDTLIIPAGKWHNLVNSGKQPLKLYSICTQPQHPFGTIHATKAETKPAEDKITDGN